MYKQAAVAFTDIYGHIPLHISVLHNLAHYNI